ncbi:MAG: hypothetical protein K9J16_08345 [Melioribacteraceae bacterium]|nr:hypothetical protein [Melioribacteraceae bacterium]MCF8353166.1 hypothetical protein [Melioribacteraceae bacterium]MCF8393134.1 hypothetical protein [Melioribacteraceae bacterium]MCF8418037.1 hypothetical protein [Melioribacteraceae bacterium]
MIEEKKLFLEKLWNLENSDRPCFIIGDLGPKVKGGKAIKNALFSTEGSVSVKERLLDPDKYLEAQLDEIEQQKSLKGEYVPALCPSLGVITFPSAFGCEVIWWENDFPAVKPLEEDFDISDLPDPKLTDGVLGRILDYTKLFLSKTDGKIPIRLTDIQGPLDNAAMILGPNNFLMKLHTDPNSVHVLMKKVTDLMINYIKEFRAVVKQNGGEFVPAMFHPWMPDGSGISISNDECVMISPEMHDEFHVPYLNQISEEFGGIYIHSCGDWTHQFTSYDNIYNLVGVEFGASEAPYDKVLDHFNGKIVTACRVGFNRDIKFTGMNDFVSKIISTAKTTKGLFINVDITNGITEEPWEETDLEQIYSLIYNSKSE